MVRKTLRSWTFLDYSIWSRQFEAGVPDAPKSTYRRPYRRPRILKTWTRWPTPKPVRERRTEMDQFIARVTSIPHRRGDLLTRVDLALYGDPLAGKRLAHAVAPPSLPAGSKWDWGPEDA